jgi:hypothetical protein
MASYRKCGFEVETVRRNIAYVNGSWCDSIEMAVTLAQYEGLESTWEAEWLLASEERQTLSPAATSQPPIG